jgi:uncharacterized caspase-like protein
MQNDVDSRSYAFDISPDEELAVLGRNDGTIKLYSTKTGAMVRSIEAAHKSLMTVIAFARDGRTFASGGADEVVKIWDTATGRLVKDMAGHTWTVRSLAFLPDGRRLLSGSGDRTMRIWNLATGQAERIIQAEQSVVRTVAVSADGKRAVSGGLDSSVKLWDLATGKMLLALAGHTGEVDSVAITPDGKRIVSGGADGTMRVWNAENGAPLATFITAANGEWLVSTPEGFFAGSRGVGPLLSVIRGREVTTIEQVHQSLYNPDLVRESLAGDPSGEVRAAAQVVDLSAVLKSGPAPDVRIIAATPGGKGTSQTATITARITDRGKGIGRIEWRLNGVTAAVTAKPGAGAELNLKQVVALDPGDNVVEVIAYNGTNLLASPPARATVKAKAATAAVKPTLHVLAIGINAYSDTGWTPPGAKQPLRFGPLGLAVKDAQAFAAAIQSAAVGKMYGKARVQVVPEEGTTRAGLEAAVKRFAEGINRADTFVFFVAAHGYSHNSRFYLIPKDYQGGPDPKALAERAVSQDQIQDWLAGIRARRAIVLLDTCESGALVAGHARSRVDEPASEASIGRLHEATGRPVLTAAASGKPALEGYKGHGIFTWALLDALKNADRNGNGMIDLLELAGHVQDLVPRLSAELDSAGRGVAALPIAASPSAGDAQSARFGSRGENFALVERLR